MNVDYNIKTIKKIYNGKVAKYENLCEILKKEKCGSLLLIFLEETKDLYINKKLTTENGDLIFSMSAEHLIKKWGHSKSVWNRSINLFAVLGLVNKYDPQNIDTKNYSFWRGAKLHKQSKVNKFQQSTGQAMFEDVIQLPNLFFHTRYDQKVLEEAEARAKILLENRFTMGCASCIFYDRVLGAEITKKVFLGRNYKPRTIYSDNLSRAIKEVLYKQIKERGYTTKNMIYKDLSIHYYHLKWWEVLKQEVQDPKKIFDLEYNRSIGIILNNDKDLVLKKATKNLVAGYYLKSYMYIIYSKKDLEKKEKISNERKKRNND